MPTTAPTMRRTGKNGWPTWRHTGLPAAPPRSAPMSGASLSHLLPPLPGFTALARTYAPWPVWSGSTTQPIRFAPMAKKAAVKLWHRARDFDRGTHQPGHHGGAVGHTALAVLHALIFDFLNHRTGRLDPSYAAIAAKAGVCVRTVATALQRLRELGHPELGAPLRRELARRPLRARAGDQRLRRAAGEPVARLPGATGAARPGPGTWGEPPPMPSALAQAALEGDLAGKVQALASDPKDGLAAALARLGRAFMARNA